MTQRQPCLQCGSPVRNIPNKYCSRTCYQQSRQVERTCPNCGRAFIIVRSNADRGRMVACSAECRVALSRTAPFIDHNGIRYHREKAHGTYVTKQGKALHVVIWEEHHGPVPPGSFIHHLDGDKSHNDITNLTLMQRRGLSFRTDTPACQECDQLARTRGLCRRHYQQLRAREKGGWKEIKRPRTVNTQS